MKGRRPFDAGSIRTMPIPFQSLCFVLVIFLSSCRGFLHSSKSDFIEFDASIGKGRHYEIDKQRTAHLIRQLASVEPRTGVVRFFWLPFWKSRGARATKVRANGDSSLFVPIYVTSKTKHAQRGCVDYVSMPFLVVLPPLSNDSVRHGAADFRDELQEELKSLTSTVSVIVTSDGSDLGEGLCLERSRPLLNLRALVPACFRACRVGYGTVEPGSFAVETVGGDLVPRSDYCFDGDSGKVALSLTLSDCAPYGPRTEIRHGLNVVFHTPGVDRFDNRILRNRAIGRTRRESVSGDHIHFGRSLYLASVPEELEKGEAVITVSASDPGGRPLTYSMFAVRDSRSQNMFRMDAASGAVVTAAKLDREFVDVHYFRVTATDSTEPGRSATSTLQIEVADVNDHAPAFEHSLYETVVREGASVGSTVVTVRATDLDAGDNAKIAYELVEAGDAAETFRIDSESGVLVTRRQLDRETVASYELTVRASDRGPVAQRKSATTTVRINLSDDNDNYPQFGRRTYAVQVPEDVNWSVNPVVAHITATDDDSGSNGALRYTLVSGNTQGKFVLDGITGQLSVAGPLDYEETRNYRLAIRVQDGGSPPRSNTTQVLVAVLDVNDNAPRFYSPSYHETVAENILVGTSILRLQAYDADDGDNARVSYAVLGAAPSMPFAIDPESGWMTAVREVDREEAPQYSFAVQAVDGGQPALSANATVTLVVQDLNDNSPKFDAESYEGVVAEDAPPGTSVLVVAAHDPDENSRLVYQITEGNHRGRFSVASQGGKGILSVAQPLDYRQEKRFVLTVSATDSGGRSDTAVVNVNVSDANTHRPVFEQAPYSTSVLEDVPVGTTVLVVSASDGDVDDNARISYSLGLEGAVASEEGDFRIDPDTGAIVTAKALDRERQAGYIVSVTAEDHGVPPLSDTTDVEITVADVNDNPPVFEKSSYQAAVVEDAPLGTSILAIKATDEDQGLNGRVRYTLESSDGAFSLDPTSGIVRTAKVLDRETASQHRIVAVAVDRGSPELSATVEAVVDVEDVNDNPPRFAADRLELFVAENSPVGTVVGSIAADDPDDGVNAKVTYSIAGGPDAEAFSLSTRDGAAEIVLRVDVDYESPRKKFDLILRAASPPLRSDVPVEVVVQDVNDNAPVLKDFAIVFNNYPRHFPRGAIGRVPAFDADVTDNLTYRFVSGNNAQLLRLDSHTGDIHLNPSLDTNVPLKATLEVSVTDGVNEVTAECHLSVLIVTDSMLFNSVSLKLGGVSQGDFLSPLMTLFVEGLAAVVPCQKEDVFLFDLQEELDSNGGADEAAAVVLKLSFSVRKGDDADGRESFYPSQFLKERIYPERALLARITTLRVLPFADDLCVREPCLDFERCLSVQKFGNASAHFLASDTVLFRAIHSIDTFACRCPAGFAGAKEHYLCDVEVDLCYSNPCRNNGTCVRNEGGYTCLCPEDFTGPDCETDVQRGSCTPGLCRANSRCSNYIQGGLFCENCTVRGGSAYVTPFCELRTRSFTRGSFLTLPSFQQRHRFSISLSFASVEPNGLLLYNGRYNDQHDFIALELVDGKMRFSFSLGSNMTRVTASAVQSLAPNEQTRLDDGQWHTVYLEYSNRSATLWLDNCDREMSLQFGSRLGGYFCANSTVQKLEARCSDPTVACHRFLDLTGPMQVGGLPSLPSSFQVTYRDFVGCIQDLRIDNRFIDLNGFVVNNGTTEGCPAKRSFCFSSPCRNGGVCEEHWKTYTCHCSVGYGGKDCEKGIDPPRHFQGDGFLVYTPSLRPIQAQWMNSLSLRTRLPHAMLMAVHLGGKSSGGEGGIAVLDLVNGSLRYSYRGMVLHLNATRLDDGKWHRTEVKWMTSGIWMTVDYGRFEVIGKTNSSIMGLYAGKVSVGGLEASENKGGSSPNFKGCIQDVRVGSDPNVWLRPSVENNVREGCPTLDHCKASPCGNASRCVSLWERRACSCLKGHYGPSCSHACQYRPCLNGGTCVPEDDAPGGYGCLCASQHRGSHCQYVTDGPCPSGWWGKPSCGPCRCPVGRGYDPNCDQVDGSCRCRTDHYQPPGGDRCFPCDCYRVGSFGTACDPTTGQCRCRAGVIGRRCEACPHSLAEVTLRGCEVIYDGCPKSFSDAIWWERTYFGESALQNCPIGARGKASRRCNVEDGWGEPDLFNCTTVGFTSVIATLAELEKGVSTLDSNSVVQLAKDVHTVANASSPIPGRLYGADILLVSRLLLKILRHESNQTGLNLSHRQDRDFLQNALEALSHLLDPSYLPLWEQIRRMGHPGPEVLLVALDRYSRTLVRNRGDTFTPPFEIVTPNIVFGMDTVSALDVRSNNDSSTLPGGHLAVALPKYNNYPARPTTFDRKSRFFLPVASLLPVDRARPALSVSSYKTLRLPPSNRSRPHGAIVLEAVEPVSVVAAVAYVFYVSVGRLLPLQFSRDVRQRWGTPLVVESPVVGLNVHSHNGTYNATQPLSRPFRIKFSVRAPAAHKDPQCAYWKAPSGRWSSAGCTTHWAKSKHGNQTTVNCTCWHLSTYAVLMDLVDEDEILDASLAEEAVTTVGLAVAILALFLSLVVFCLLRGLQTNSNTIHKNLALCALLVCAIFLVALRMRKTLVHKEFPCKLTAIFLHHLYLCQFSWMLVEGLHLYRMLTEMRDINHGQMRFYYSVGYGAPAIVVGLAVGVRADEYGNPIFCWLSVYGSAVWSLVGPICFMVMLNLGIFVMAIHASVRMKAHVEDFGNLKTLLWLGIVLLPLMGATWVLAVLAVNENHPVLYYLFSFFVAAQGIYVFLGYCILNEKVRSRLRGSWCKGKKGARTNAGMNTSSQTTVSRSALAYHNNSFDVLHRNVGISTSSTTSRSTCKTSGSPFRPHTATSTSTPPSQCPSDFLHSHSLDVGQRSTDRSKRCRSNLYGYQKPSRLQQVEDPDTGEVYAKKSGDSDTESDLSLDHASLDLASSHSSDEEDPKGGTVKPSWLQNGGPRPALRLRHQQDAPSNSSHLVYAPNILSNEPNVGRGYNIPASLDIYSTQWSARGPASLPPFIPRPGLDDASPRDVDADRASVATASDNELNLQNEPSLTEAVFSRFSPPLIDADEMSSPEQLPAPDGGFASLDNDLPRAMGLLLAERRMVVPPMITASIDSEDKNNNVADEV